METKLAELNPGQTGTSHTEKTNRGSVPSHGPTFIKAGLYPGPAGVASRAFEKYAFCVHGTSISKEMYRFAYMEWLVMKPEFVSFPSVRKSSVSRTRDALLFGLSDLGVDADFKDCNFTKR